FYGPEARLAVTTATVFERLKAGKTPQWIGSTKTIRTLTYTPDAGRAVAVLGRSPEAFGQVWHLPTRDQLITGEAFVRMACEAAGRPYRIQAVPSWLLRMIGFFNPLLGEMREMLYQYVEDYHFDSSKIEAAYGLAATPYPEGIAATLAAG